MRCSVLLSALLSAFLCTLLVSVEPAASRLELRDGDVVAFVGGELVAAQGETGHFESLLAAAYPGVKLKFRNLGWEGDTVFEQPRDLNFPGLAEQLKRAAATIVFMEFGRAESLAGSAGVGAFAASYEKLCDALAAPSRRLVLLTPPPFEKPAHTALPDLSTRNDDLRLYAQASIDLAKRRGLTSVDVFGELTTESRPRLTGPDGMHPTSEGAGVIANVAARRLGLAPGDLSRPSFETLRQAVVAKNKLWFEYSRPMNWAFLGGDRQFVPSSRDPRDLNIRIFPRELEKFVPLIEQADAKIIELAKAAGVDSK